MNSDNTPQDVRAWQRRVFWILWGAYASYYFARLNFSVAQPLILKEFPDWTAAKIGLIPSTYAFTYMLGQIVNGTLAHKLGARRMMATAMLGIGAVNIAFANAHSFSVMIGLWAINGFLQSAGWTLMIGTISNWHASARRGTVIGLLSTCYQVGNVAAWLLAGQVSQSFGWRAAFLIPGLLIIPAALVVFFFSKDTPEEAGLPAQRDDVFVQQKGSDILVAATDIGMLEAVRLTLANRVLWILSLSFFFSNCVRYAFMNWSVSYVAEVHHRTIKGSAFMAVALPLVGVLGAVSAGWLSDTLFKGRRAPLCAIMLFLLAIICVLFPQVPAGQWLWATLLLALAGFMIYGPDMLMSGAATVDLGHPKCASVATGMTMAFGSAGAIISGTGIGKVKDLAHGDWTNVFFLLAGFSLVAVALMSTLWNAQPKTKK